MNDPVKMVHRSTEELIRLGKIYKKKRSRRKYYVLLVAVLCALGVGTVSFGDGKKVFTKIQGIFNKGTHTRISDGDDDKFDGVIKASEEDVYEKIEEKFGFAPIKLLYLPGGMQFVEANIEYETQNARLYYKGKEGESIIFRVITDYRTGLVSADIEDVYIREYEKTVNNTNVLITEYEIKENKASRWSVVFEHKDAQYTLIATGIQQQEVEKIVDNLYL
ncbi:MAG: DUF4367 domain-containing protein [Tyzzerella sp.]|nr:DUF4367 domain-containing protein [Tyzzerella sp.]